MWGQVRDIAGNDADRERLRMVDFESAAINAPGETFPKSTVAGCYFHLGQSVFRRVQNPGLAEKFGEDDDFEHRVGKLPEPAAPPS